MSFAPSAFRQCFHMHFTREGVRIPLPFLWIAELNEIETNARKLRRILAEAQRGKPRILSKWERELGA